MDDLVVALVSAVLGAIIGAVLTFLVAEYRWRKENEQKSKQETARLRTAYIAEMRLNSQMGQEVLNETKDFDLSPSSDSWDYIPLVLFAVEAITAEIRAGCPDLKPDAPVESLKIEDLISIHFRLSSANYIAHKIQYGRLDRFESREYLSRIKTAVEELNESLKKIDNVQSTNE